VKLNRWSAFPPAIKRHLSERLLDRSITLNDLNKLRIWVESDPDLPDGDWFLDFGSFKIAGRGPFPRTFLDSHQIAYGEEIRAEDDADSAIAD
jgi:hypothetical protein